jgi:hypothetical protein
MLKKYKPWFLTLITEGLHKKTFFFKISQESKIMNVYVGP